MVGYTIDVKENSEPRVPFKNCLKLVICSSKQIITTVYLNAKKVISIEIHGEKFAYKETNDYF
jgi:hypothetical protein